MKSCINRIRKHVIQRRLLVQMSEKKSERHMEKTKVIVDNSATTAIRRCLLHVLPVCSTTLMLIINIKGVFLGSDFVGPIKSETINLMLLQIAAKIHELLIIASLGLIVLQMVRHELLFGTGLPLGLVGSGLTFSNIGFFFQKEFYGALRYVASGNIARKICFVAILMVAGLVASLAGPASAVLLVPKTQTWPAGGTPFYLNGSSEHFWPEDLSGELSELHAYCSTENSTSISVCPGAGFQSLWQHWGRMNYTNFMQKDVRSYAKSLSGSRFYWPVYSADSLVPPLYALGNFRKDKLPSSNTFLVQPHAAVATVLQRISDDWWDALVNEQHMDARIVDDRQISALFVRTPLASVRCSEPQNVSAIDSVIKLPTIGGRFFYSTVADFNLTTNASIRPDHMQFNWVHLPDTFGAASIGGIFESPWTSDNKSRMVIGCTAQLGWIPTTLYTDEYTFWTGWYPWNLRFGDRTPEFTGVPAGAALPPTDGRIAIGNAWLALLTPTATISDSSNSGWSPSTIESILINAGFNDFTAVPGSIDMTNDWIDANAQNDSKTAFLEVIIASVLVDGLSRTGVDRVFDTRGPSSQWSLSPYDPEPNFGNALFANRTAFITPENVDPTSLTTLRVDMLISGFSFRTSLAGYLSASVLLTHMFMALVHTAWILFNRHSSWSWNSISELITLAQNSTPALKVLKNTGSGVEKAITFSKIAKIRVVPSTHVDEPDRVELVFEEDDCNHDTESNVNLDKDEEAVEMQHRHTTINPAETPMKLGVGSAATWPPQRNEPDTDSGSERAEHDGANSVADKGARHLAASATWPAERRKSSVPDILEVERRSNSTERLIPRVMNFGSVVRTRESVKVEVNNAYG